MRLRIDATDEAEFVSGVAERLAEWNWEVDREVTPDDGSARVDLLIRHGKCGPIGIEAKYLVDKAPARRVAEAIRQIEQYRRQQFDGDTIDFWAVAPYFSDSQPLDVNDPVRIKYRYIKGLVNNLGIGFVDIYPWNPEIVFGTMPKQRLSIPEPPRKIPRRLRRTVKDKRL